MPMPVPDFRVKENYATYFKKDGTKCVVPVSTDAKHNSGVRRTHSAGSVDFETRPDDPPL
jgi:Iap family predicted aminopeptidase